MGLFWLNFDFWALLILHNFVFQALLILGTFECCVTFAFGALYIFGYFLGWEGYFGFWDTFYHGALWRLGYFGFWDTSDFGALCILGTLDFGALLILGYFDFGVLFILGYFFYFMELLIYGNF